MGEQCEICGAACGWEPGRVVMVPEDDEQEAGRRMTAHLKAIVCGAGSSGITMRRLVEMLGHKDYDEDDADDIIRATSAVSA